MGARSAVALAISLLVTWAVAGPAAALESGVFIDPGSPAGKEYSVPLSVLRGAASGRPGGGGATQPLFGVGISSARLGIGSARAATKAGPGALHRGRSPRRTPAPPAGTNGSGTGTNTTGPATKPGAADLGGVASDNGPTLADLTRHGSSTAAVALIGALVVLGGLALGAVILATGRRLG